MIEKLIDESTFHPQLLRKEAEKRLKERTPPATVHEPEKLLHELQVHQIELEMQIEALHKTKAELEVALRTSDRLFAFAPIPYLLIDREGAIKSINHAGVMFFNEPEKRLCTKNISEFIPETDQTRFFEHLHKVIGSKSTETYELQLSILGQPYWVLLDLVAEPGGLRFLVAIEDIDGRKQQENYMLNMNQELESRVQARTLDLQNSEERYRLAMRASDSGLWDYDCLTDTVISNTRYLTMLGYKPGDLPETLSGKFTDLLHPDDRGPKLKAIFDAFETTGRHQTEFRLRSKNGGYRWILGRGEIIKRDAAGKALRIIGTHVDITHRKQSELDRETLLTETEHRYQTIVEAVHEGIWLLDVAGRITFSNQRLCTMLGLEMKDLVGSSWLELVADDWKATAKTRLSDLNQASSVQFELKLRQSQDKELWVILMATPTRAAGGQLNGSLGLVMDIGVRKTLEQEVQHHISKLTLEDQRKSEFLAVLSHELRNPLAPICTAAELLKQPGLNASEIDWCRQVIERQTGQLKRLVDDLLDLSRINQGKIEILPASTRLTEIINHAVETSQPFITSRNHQLNIELPEEPVEIRVDPARLSQVLSNLLDNAAKFTHPGGTITVTGETVDDQLVIRVKDTGVGIATEDQATVFELFTQIHDPLVSTGLGVGLNLSSQIIALHGGSLKLYSAGPGLGSEFSIWLPLHPS